MIESKGEIFTDTFNTFSRLVVTSRNGKGQVFDIPTIPLTHIQILESKKLIIGFSKYVLSPYNIVIYSLQGELLYKRSFNYFELKCTKKEIKQLLDKYPNLIGCFQQSVLVIKDKDNYHIELTNCMRNILLRDSTFSLSEHSIRNPYFPLLSSTTAPLFNPMKCSYQEYDGFFDDTDPYYDLVSIGSVPYLLILNDTKGQKVNIPLISNCDILKELKN